MTYVVWQEQTGSSAACAPLGSPHVQVARTCAIRLETIPNLPDFRIPRSMLRFYRMAHDAKTHDEIKRLKGEVDSLAGELDKALGDAVYMPMSAKEQKVYDAKQGTLARLKQQLAQLIHGENPEQ